MALKPGKPRDAIQAPPHGPGAPARTARAPMPVHLEAVAMPATTGVASPRRGHLVIGVVEDNDDLRESIVELLAGEGHRVVGFSCAEELFELKHGFSFELMVIDLNLPGEDGLSLSVRLKRAQPQLRVLMMTTRVMVSDRVRGYQSGADLYLPKPVAEEELLASIEALGRQLQAQGKPGGAFGVELRLDVKSLKLYGPHGEVGLNRRESATLSALATAPGLRLEHWQLIEILGLSDGGGRGTLAVTMTRLRGKVEQVGGGHEAIKALRSEGYQLCVPLEIA